MAAVVTALFLQLAWRVALVVLDQWGLAESPRLPGLTFGINVAVAGVMAAGLFGVTRRVSAARRIGAWVAAVAYAATAIAMIGYEALIYRGHHFPASWLSWMYHYGWAALGVLAMAGLGIAAGRRGAWLAPPAAALAILLDDHSSEWSPFAALAMTGGIAVLVVLLVDEATRRAPPPSNETGVAARAMRTVELVAWSAAGISMLWFVQSLETRSVYVVFATTIASWVTQLLFVRAVWSLAKAALAGVPSWLWFFSATCTLAAVARSVRTWFLTITRWWGRFDEVPLAHAHWSTDVLPVLAAASALVAVAILGHRNQSREVTRAALLAAIASAMAFAVRFGFPHDSVAAVYVVANIAAAGAYRVARSLLAPVPTARVLI